MSVKGMIFVLKLGVWKSQ